MAAARATRQRQDGLVEVGGDQVAVRDGAIGGVRVHPQPIRVARAPEQGEELAIDGIRDGPKVIAPDGEPPDLGEAAPLARIAVGDLEREAVLPDGGGDVHHVEDLAPGRPRDGRLAARGLERVADGAQMLLPGERARSRAPRVGRRRVWCEVVVLVVAVRVDGDPGALSAHGGGAVVGAQACAVQA